MQNHTIWNYGDSSFINHSQSDRVVISCTPNIRSISIRFVTTYDGIQRDIVFFYNLMLPVVLPRPMNENSFNTYESTVIKLHKKGKLCKYIFKINMPCLIKWTCSFFSIWRIKYAWKSLANFSGRKDTYVTITSSSNVQIPSQVDSTNTGKFWLVAVWFRNPCNRCWFRGHRRTYWTRYKRA